MLLGLHMVVKDEEEHLRRCLESVKSIVDEIIIVDTGSNDRTVDIAKSYGATVIETTWENDFSYVRNLSLKRSNTIWNIFLDADEIITGDLEKIRQSIVDSDKEAFWVVIESLTGSLPYEKLIHSSIRIFRSRPQYYFKGPIHEDILPSILEHDVSKESIGAIEVAKIIHYGYLPEIQQQKQKAQRNLNILQSALRDNPNQPYYKYHLGLTYEQMGNNQEAVSFIQRALNEVDTNTSFRPTMVKDLAKILIKIGKYDTVISFLKTELQNYPNYPDLHYYLGVSHFNKNEEDHAIRAFQTATQQTPSNKYILENGKGSFHSWTLMGDIALKWNANADALKFYINALNHCPFYYEALFGFSDVLIAHNISNKEIKKELTHLLSPTLVQIQVRQVCMPHIANALFSSGCYLEFLEILQDLGDTSFISKENIILSYLYMGDGERAQKEITKFLKQGVHLLDPVLQSMFVFYWENSKPFPKEMLTAIQSSTKPLYYLKILDLIPNASKIEENVEFLLFLKDFIHQAIIMRAGNVLKSLLSKYPFFQLFAAKMKYYEGYVNEAADDLSMLMNDKVIDDEGIFLLGEYSYDYGRWEEASLLFEKVLLHQPDHNNARIGASLCYNQQAKELLQDSCEKLPEYPLFTSYLNKINLAIELSNKYSWHSNWRGRQRRNRNEQHLSLHDRQK
ncbi:glycosyltransferase [Bacillus sp. BRMEA1]|uniref:TPR domain-containing glycosyltransferase n=1 Tax=Neobacillus endophyticus TaxID=2738405 RepID=UPI001564D963|nr:TPR domain-containing glycosyltransferase [Neobacillus endophyticus]NRD79494.1 glycosyltransferase [Neobacillus endophyticus]